MRIRESALVASVVNAVVTAGYRHRVEFGVLGRIADVFAVDPESGTSIAVECKERDWRRALMQARTYQGAADFVFVAMPAYRVTTSVRADALQYGVGLLELTHDGVLRTAVPACTAAHMTGALRATTVTRLLEASA